MFRFTAITLLLCAFTLPAVAQTSAPRIVTGRTIDADDESPLPGVNVVLTAMEDSTRMTAAISDGEGVFSIRVPQEGAYRLRASFVGYKTLIRPVVVDSARNDVGILAMQPDVLGLGEIVVEDVQERYRVRGDTIIFNADAFRVNPDASAQDLVEKMPGVVVQDGQVQAQGEQVQRVTVDGREFFGSDPTVALRNVPADIIQSIEVFDRQSDQAQFTGFNDGNTQKTINIITRTGMSNGQFGKVYGGYGADERYIAGGDINIFDGDRRVSIIGLANNVNQQNFAFEDLLGLMGSSGPRGGGPPRGMMRMRGGGPPGGGGGFRGPGGGGFNPGDFLIGQQSGLSSTASLGLNYSDNFGSKVEFSGSYFFNRVENTNEALLDREFFLPGEQSQFYNESQASTGTNYNHRLNARLEYKIDDNNSLMVRPRLSFQDNSSQSLLSGANMLDSGALLSQTLNNYSSQNYGFTSSTDVLFRHRFPKEGRTISTNLQVGLNGRWGDTDQYAVTDFFQEDAENDNDLTYDQAIDSESASRSFEIDIDYTEPIGENGQLRLSYEPSYGKNVSDRSAYVLDLQTGRYTILDPSYSSMFDNDVIRQRGGVAFQKRVQGKYDFNVGLDYQNERLLGDQTYPVAFELDRTFHSILPQARLGLNFGGNADWRIFYRTNTNTPSVSQLQDVIDNTNPLLLTSGNPNLRPSYSHSLNTRFRLGDWRAGRMFFGFANVTYNLNPIGTASLLAVRDTVLAQGVTLAAGSQYSYPVNLEDGSFNARSFLVYGTPVAPIKSNVNMRGGLSFSRSPGLINGVLNTADQFGINGGITVASNISERVDFTASYNGDYVVASNSFYEQLDANYMRHSTGFRASLMPIGGLVLESELNYNTYTGLDNDLYPSSFILNAGVGYKFLRQNAAELKLVLGDILNQETGINRSITEAYIEDSRTQVLGRYVLLNLSYRVRNFGI